MWGGVVLGGELGPVRGLLGDGILRQSGRLVWFKGSSLAPSSLVVREGSWCKELGIGETSEREDFQDNS